MSLDEPVSPAFSIIVSPATSVLSDGPKKSNFQFFQVLIVIRTGMITSKLFALLELKLRVQGDNFPMAGT